MARPRCRSAVASSVPDALSQKRSGDGRELVDHEAARRSESVRVGGLDGNSKGRGRRGIAGQRADDDRVVRLHLRALCDGEQVEVRLAPEGLASDVRHPHLNEAHALLPPARAVGADDESVALRDWRETRLPVRDLFSRQYRRPSDYSRPCHPRLGPL